MIDILGGGIDSSVHIQLHLLHDHDKELIVRGHVAVYLPVLSCQELGVSGLKLSESIHNVKPVSSLGLKRVAVVFRDTMSLLPVIVQNDPSGHGVALEDPVGQYAPIGHILASFILIDPV